MWVIFNANVLIVYDLFRFQYQILIMTWESITIHEFYELWSSNRDFVLTRSFSLAFSNRFRDFSRIVVVICVISDDHHL